MSAERVTEYLDLDLEAGVWRCHCCAEELGPAGESYKRGMLVHARDPREIHRPLIDERSYAYTFAPDPAWCRIVEYYCPKCGTLAETEYLVPGHPITHDIELDLEWLRRRAAARREERS